MAKAFFAKHGVSYEEKDVLSAVYMLVESNVLITLGHRKTLTIKLGTHEE